MGAEVINLTKKTINLSKGEKINLTKTTSKLKNIRIGLGWDPVNNKIKVKEVTRYKRRNPFLRWFFDEKEVKIEETVAIKNISSPDIDCDAWLILSQNENFSDISNVIFYKNLIMKNSLNKKCIEHHGDNLTGAGVNGSDKEQITVSLEDLPKVINAILVGVTIYQGEARNQTFDDVKNTFIRIVDLDDNNFEICRFNSENIKDADCNCPHTFIAGKLVNSKDGWEFKALGKCTEDSLISQVVQRLNSGCIQLH